ncbi:MAG: sensor histidine kinase [Reyranella sp.]|nr:sensor histidine kinase [Reyranella sp.]
MLHLVKPSAPPISLGPDGEIHRLELLKRYEILDTPPEAAFDRITALAADLFDAPIAIVSFLDGHRLWFKSHHGLDDTEVRWGPEAAVSTMETMIRGELGVGFFVSAPLITHEGHYLGALCVIDHHPREADERQLRHLATLAALVTDRLELRLIAHNAAARAEILAAEIDHRAMNSLQLVASLLHLQSRAAPTPEAAQQLAIAANRVMAVARVHRNFSANESIESVPVVAYLRRLGGELADVLGVVIDVEGTETSVPTKQLLAIGLVVNELATNATKHGAGPLKITFMPAAAGQYELCVLDEGPGLPDGFDVSRHKGIGLGIQVVRALVAQLEGHLSAGANPAGRGACFTVTFPCATPATDAGLRHLG